MASSGNFAVLNTLIRPVGSTSRTTSNGNTTISSSSGSWGAPITLAANTGKWYIEFYVNAGSSGRNVGMVPTNSLKYNDGDYGQGAAGDYIITLNSGGSLYNNGSVTQTVASNMATGDIMSVAMNLDASPKTVQFYKNGSTIGSAENINSSATGHYTFMTKGHNQSTVTMNAGQDSSFAGVKTSGSANAADDNGFGDFYYTPPSGFLSMTSANLPISDDIDPAQTDDNIPTKQFNAITYTGNGSTNAITGLGFKPDLVWVKRRNSSGDNRLVDSSRGVGVALRSNVNGADVSESNGVTAFGTDGFTLGSEGGYNASSDTFIGWCWRANGGTTTTDTSGDISTVRQSNTASGFAILTWSGNGSNNQRLPHGLGVKPALVIAKRRDSAQSWGVWTQYLGANSKELQLESSSAQQNSGNGWYQSGMTTDFVGIGSDRNTSSSTNVAYVWADVEGSQKFGTYIGNNTDNDGPFVYTGFRPRMIVIKGATEAYPWFVFDSARNPHNLVDKHLRWNGADAEATEPTGARKVDFLSNGFKVMADEASLNGSGDTYVYMAWGDVPFKYNNTF